MSDSELFDSDRFLSLTGSQLVGYAEPFVNTKTNAVPGSAFDFLRSRLPNMDEAHTVYALELCMNLKPGEFVGVVVDHLSHASAAVCSTAFRLLERVRRESLPSTLVTQIATTPVVDLFADDVRTGARRNVGTNKEFVRNLMAAFAAPAPEIQNTPTGSLSRHSVG